MFNMTLHFSPSTTEIFYMSTEVDGIMRSYISLSLKRVILTKNLKKVLVYIKILQNTAKIKCFGLQILK